MGHADWFEVEMGLKLLFVIVMDEIHKELKEKLPHSTWAWLFADDTVSFGNNELEVQLQLDAWYKTLQDWGLRISREKSKTMVMTTRNSSD